MQAGSSVQGLRGFSRRADCGRGPCAEMAARLCSPRSLLSHQEALTSPQGSHLKREGSQHSDPLRESGRANIGAGLTARGRSDVAC